VTEIAGKTTREFRRRNRSAIFRLLYFHGPLGREELRARLGLSPASVSAIITALIAEKTVIETKIKPSDSERKRSALQVNHDRFAVTGIDIHDKGIQIEIFDLALAGRACVDLPLRHDTDSHSVMELIETGLRLAVRSAGISDCEVIGTGINLPAMTRPASNISDAQDLDFAAAHLECSLRALMTKPLLIDDKTVAMGRADIFFGASDTTRSNVVIIIGSSVDAIITTNDGVCHGEIGRSTEWGHTVVHIRGRQCRCGAFGCIEAYIGADAVLDRYREISRVDSRLAKNQELALGELLRMAGDKGGGRRAEHARTVLDETARYIGIGIGGLINMINPERIILSGWAGLLLGRQILGRIREFAEVNSLPGPFSQTHIELSKLDPHAHTKNAATLVVSQFINNG
jgi:predicted NBD/HSP70 family sugar kinase